MKKMLARLAQRLTHNLARPVVARRQSGVLRQHAALDRRGGLERDRGRVLAPRAGVGAVSHGLKSRDQMVLAVANQVRAAHCIDGFAGQWRVVGRLGLH
jgi:hypothetical protein